MTEAYPLRTIPLFRDYLWGGRKLATALNKPLPAEGVWAESWEIVDHPEHSSIVANGSLAGHSLKQVLNTSPQWLLGDSESQTPAGDGPAVAGLPLLLKYLDCNRVLSVQVHPEDSYALRMSPPDLGKTEAWYIVDAAPDAVLYAGLRAGVSRVDLAHALQTGDLPGCLHEIHPQAGDCVFIPAGTVHALGAGLLVAEIQQASNTTFRLFDWNRADASGKPRPLHIEQSLEVIDFKSGPRPLQLPQPTPQAGRERLVQCDKFVFDRLTRVEGEPTIELARDNRLHFLTVPAGEARLTWAGGADLVQRGQSVLVPAALETLSVELAPDTILLDMYC